MNLTLSYFLTQNEKYTPFLPLQYFASNEEQGKTEEPTERKLQKAKKEGRVAKTQDLASSLVVLVPLLALLAFSPFFTSQMFKMFNTYFSAIGDPNHALNHSGLAAALFYFFAVGGFLILLAALGAILGNVVQTGFLFSTKPIIPRLNKVSPNFSRFLKKSLFSKEGLYNFFKMIIKIGAIIYISYLIFHVRENTLFKGNYSLLSVKDYIVTGEMIIIFNGIFIFVVAIIDFFVQRRFFRSQLKMTKQEIKEERKETEGDPLIKGRIRDRMKRILMQDIVKNIKSASVVITNPTHYAIALEWDSKRMLAPIVVAKGVDYLAQRIKAIARENSVPIVENKPLARALYSNVELGEAINEEYWEIVSQILVEVYRLSGERVG